MSDVDSQFGLDELESIITAEQVRLADEEDDMEFCGDRLRIRGMPGTWVVEDNRIYGPDDRLVAGAIPHVLLLKMEPIWFTQAIHIGLVEGPCPPGCLTTIADIRARNRLRPRVEFGGRTWKLRGSDNIGEPTYIAHRNGGPAEGWVARLPWCEARDKTKRWEAGDCLGADRKPLCFVTMKQAMRQVLREAQAEEACPHCGADPRHQKRA